MSMEPKALFLGVLNIDMVLEATDHVIGNKIQGSKVSTHAGGYGSTQSIGCVRSGVRSRVLGRIGDDAFGAEIISTLQSEGVDSSLVETLKDEKTGLSTIIVRTNEENMYLDFLGANHKLDVQYIRSNMNTIRNAEFLGAHIGVATIEPGMELLKQAEKFEIPIVVNLSSVKLPKNIFSTNPDYIMLSFSSASNLCGFPVTNIKGARIASAMLLPYAKKAIIFQMEESGTMISTTQYCEVIQQKVPTKIIDPSGMSDFSLGVFVAQMIKGRDLLESAEIAYRAAMYCGSQIGVYESFPTKEHIAESIEF